VAFITGAFCYISDVSSPAERSWRMGVAEAALLVGLPSGLAISSFLLKWGGYVVLCKKYCNSRVLTLEFCLQSVFGTSCVMCALAFLYTFFFVSESIHESEMSGAQGVFDFNLIKDMLHTCCKKRPAYRRLTMFLVMIMMAIIIFALDGRNHDIFLYMPTTEALFQVICQWPTCTPEKNLVGPSKILLCIALPVV
jgi:MFS transporter, PCFT/HCP family, solute carrier family 46 (folate transporter), member 1